jgi:hypothetical protein
VVSRSGAVRLGIDSPSVFDAEPACFPLNFRFSPDGRWLAGVAWNGSIDIIPTSALDAATEDYPFVRPDVSLPEPCGASGDGSLGTPARSAFGHDGRMLVTESGSRYSTGDWQVLTPPSTAPVPYSLFSSLEISRLEQVMVSNCHPRDGAQVCTPYPAPFPKFSPEGRWVVAGGTLSHAGRSLKRVLDATAHVGIFAPNGDVIVASADNSLTRYCKLP